MPETDNILPEIEAEQQKVTASTFADYPSPINSTVASDESVEQFNVSQGDSEKNKLKGSSSSDADGAKKLVTEELVEFDNLKDLLKQGVETNIIDVEEGQQLKESLKRSKTPGRARRKPQESSLAKMIAGGNSLVSGGLTRVSNGVTAIKDASLEGYNYLKPKVRALIPASKKGRIALGVGAVALSIAAMYYCNPDGTVAQCVDSGYKTIADSCNAVTEACGQKLTEGYNAITGFCSSCYEQCREYLQSTEVITPDPSSQNLEGTLINPSPSIQEILNAIKIQYSKIVSQSISKPCDPSLRTVDDYIALGHQLLSHLEGEFPRNSSNTL